MVEGRMSDEPMDNLVSRLIVCQSAHTCTYLHVGTIHSHVGSAGLLPRGERQLSSSVRCRFRTSRVCNR